MFARSRENCAQPLLIFRKSQMRGRFRFCLLAGVLLCTTPPRLPAQCLPAADGLVAWWAGDGDATDSAGDLDGTLVGTTFAPGFVTSGGGQAFSFDGVDDNLDLSAHTPALDFSPAATFELWVRPAAEPNGALFTISDGSSVTEQRLVFGLGDGFTETLTDEIVTVGRIEGPDTYILGFTTSDRSEVFDGSFHHVALTFDGSEVKIYLDGVPKAITVGFGADSGTYGAIPGAANATIGAQYLDGPLGFHTGLIDEFKVYDRALSDAEILGIFQAGVEGTCKTPTQKLQLLASQVMALNLSNGISNALDVKLETAVNALDDLNNHNDIAAINSLNAFVNHVEAQRGSELTDEQANILIESAQAIIAAIESQN